MRALAHLLASKHGAAARVLLPLSFGGGFFYTLATGTNPLEDARAWVTGEHGTGKGRGWGGRGAGVGGDRHPLLPAGSPSRSPRCPAFAAPSTRRAGRCLLPCACRGG
jgi:hypothetical protein